MTECIVPICYTEKNGDQISNACAVAERMMAGKEMHVRREREKCIDYR